MGERLTSISAEIIDAKRVVVVAVVAWPSIAFY